MKLFNKLNNTSVSVMFVVLAMISLTAGASIAKSIFNVLSPVTITAFRLIVSAILLSFILQIWRSKISLGDTVSIALYGLTIAGMNLFFYLSIETIPVGIALAIELMGPLLVATIFSNQKSDYLWVVLAVLGILILLVPSVGSSELAGIGVLYAGIAAAFWGGYVVVGKKVSRKHGIRASALGLVFASFTMMPLAIEPMSSVEINAKLVGMIVLIAILSSAIPLVLEIRALNCLSTKTYGVLTAGEPVLGAFTSFLILGEVLNFWQLLGVSAVIFASIGVINFDISREELKSRSSKSVSA